MQTRIFIFLLLLSYSCQNGADEGEFAHCRYNAPEPIFHPAIPDITDHHFELRGNTGLERISFSDGLLLSIQQSGCDFLQQEYRFFLEQEITDPDPQFWFSLAAALLGRLSALGPEYLIFDAWADAIEARQAGMKLGEMKEVQPGFYLQVDHSLQEGRTIVMLTFSQQP